MSYREQRAAFWYAPQFMNKLQCIINFETHYSSISLENWEILRIYLFMNSVNEKTRDSPKKVFYSIHQKLIVGVVNDLLAPDLANIPETYVLVVISHFEQERAFLWQGKSYNFLALINYKNLASQLCTHHLCLKKDLIYYKVGLITQSLEKLLFEKQVIFLFYIQPFCKSSLLKSIRANILDIEKKWSSAKKWLPVFKLLYMTCWPIIFEIYVKSNLHEWYQLILSYTQHSCHKVEF